MTTTDTRQHTSRDTGLLVSIEGIAGAGKTTLAKALPPLLAPRETVVLEEFSQRLTSPAPDRSHETDQPGYVGRQILRALADDGDYFLRAGLPRTETLLLFAIKTFDYETVRPALDNGTIVLEGRSVHCTAVYQSLILHPNDDTAAFEEACNLIDDIQPWRPPPRPRDPPRRRPTNRSRTR